MKAPVYWIGLSTACQFVSAIHLQARSNVPLASLDIQRRSTSGFSAPARDRLRKRGTVSVTLDNLATLYFANVSMGSPGQELRLDIDTGSSDIWANSARSSLCQQYASQCKVSGTYNANSSSSYKYMNSDFQIKYADGSFARGDYATDTLSMGGTKLSNVPFGIGYSSTSAQGILGIGYPSNEASVGTTGKSYNNLPQVMVSDKVINTPAYSLWLNDLSANTGSVLFGGVDTDKYHGDLQTLPIIPEAGVYREFIIGLTGLKAGGQNVMNSPVPVLLDSGSSLTYLPSDIAQSIFTIFSATYSNQAGAAIVSCNLMNSQATVDFTFSGVTINVPLNELVIVDGVRRGQSVCILGISDAGDSTAVLGDTFLRSTYVVYDLANNEISLAQTNFNATSSSVKEITSSGPPGASKVQNAVSTLAVGTGGARGPQVTAISIGAAPAAVTPAPAALRVGGMVAAAAAGLAIVL